MRTDSGSLLKITPMELIKLAPRLKPYLNNQAPSWPEIVDARRLAPRRNGDFQIHLGRRLPRHWGVSKPRSPSRLSSGKPPAHFRLSPGGYFHGMVSKAKAGELHLARTIWGMRGSGERRLK